MVTRSVRWYYQIHPDDRSRWNEEAATLFLSGQPLRSVYRLITRDGHPVWFQCEAKMVRRPDGRPWFIHGVAFDISDIKRAEQALLVAHDELELRVRDRTAELAAMNAELEKVITRRRLQVDLGRQAAALARSKEALARSNEDLEQFAYSASHDLREPIRNLAVYSEWLSRDYKDNLDEKAQVFLKILTDSAGRMSQLIQDLLEYTRVSADLAETEYATDANQILATVLQNLEIAIRDGEAVIISERLPSVNLSPVRLQQVLQNLVLNAIKYRGEEPLRVHISAALEEGFWRFAVKDNGMGIAPEYHDQIFGIFKRLSRGGGTGMGLAICKRILQRAKGRIWVESERGQGAPFCLPCRLQRANRRTRKNKFREFGRAIPAESKKSESYWPLLEGCQNRSTEYHARADRLLGAESRAIMSAGTLWAADLDRPPHLKVPSSLRTSLQLACFWRYWRRHARSLLAAVRLPGLHLSAELSNLREVAASALGLSDGAVLSK